MYCGVFWLTNNTMLTCRGNVTVPEGKHSYYLYLCLLCVLENINTVDKDKNRPDLQTDAFIQSA